MPRPDTVTGKQILQLVESQEYRCAITKRALTPESASLDHIIPLSRGGSHSIENLCVVDQQVNAAKGSMTTDEFVALCREVAQANG